MKGEKKYQSNLEYTKVQVYNQELQLIYRGHIRKDQEPKLRDLLAGCSLLFDAHDTGYFLKKS